MGAGRAVDHGAITGIPPDVRGRWGRTAALPRPGTVAMPNTSATSVGHACPCQGCTREAPLLTLHQIPPCAPTLPNAQFSQRPRVGDQKDAPRSLSVAASGERFVEQVIDPDQLVQAIDQITG